MMQKAVVIDLQEFRQRREAQRRQQAKAATQFVPMMPVMMWYPVQWMWVWPSPVPASATA